MSEPNLEALEERIEYWVGEKEAVERSLDSLEATLEEINSYLGDLYEQADATESASDDEEQAWLFAQQMEQDDE